MMPLEDPNTVMRQAQYQVCNDFIGKLKDGCPEVTAMITEYPKLVGVIKVRDFELLIDNKTMYSL